MCYILFCVTIQFFLSCQRDSSPVHPQPKPAEFPLAVGSVWEYLVTDTLVYQFQPDTLQVQEGTLQMQIMVSETSIEGNQKTTRQQWVCRFNNEVDTIQVMMVNDTLFWGGYPRFHLPQLAILFPLQVHRKWQHLNCDSSQVAGQETLSLPVGIVQEAFRIQRVDNCEVETGREETIWIKPQIGMVRLKSTYMNYHYLYGRRFLWRLKSYSIASW